MTLKQLLLYLYIGSIFLLTSCEKEERPVVETPPPTTTPTPTTPDQPSIEKGDFRIAFYNVENLFDTVDDENNPKDDEFLPSAAKQWNEERYQKKIGDIGKVIEGMEYPIIMGFSEVENAKVLQDLVDSDLLKAKDYGIVHYDSPDFRGIDVALIYQKSTFTVVDSRAIEVALPASVSEFSTTRDILMVQGVYKGEDLYLFVNHWPSRSTGTSETSGKREYAASVLKQEIEEVLTENVDANIITLGDFNDEPTNRSLATVLMANVEKPITLDNQLYNCTQPLRTTGEGSYWFRGDWQMLDQAIVSGKLLDDNGALKVVGYNVFKEDFVLFDHPDDGLRPDRTFGGDNYYGGISDHLAVFLEVNNL